MPQLDRAVSWGPHLRVLPPRKNLMLASRITAPTSAPKRTLMLKSFLVDRSGADSGEISQPSNMACARDSA